MKNKVIILSLLMLFFTTVSFAQTTQIDGSQIKDSSIAASKIIGGITSGSANTTIEVEAGESLTAGQIVSLISESGTMKAYNNALTVSTSPNGAESVFNSAATTYCSAVALDSTRFLVAYQDSDTYPKAIVGTVSGSTISWGAESAAFENVAATYLSACKIGTDKIFIAYKNGTTDTRMVVLTVSTATITVGSPATLDNNYGTYISVTTLDTDKALVCYFEDETADKGQSKIVTVSGTTPTPYPDAATAGTEFNAAATAYISVSALSSTSAIVAYQDGGNSSYGTSQILSISGTTITPGAEYVFADTLASAYISCVALSSTSAAIAFTYDAATNYTGKVIAGSVSGTTITFGTAAVFNETAYTIRNSMAKINGTTVLISFARSGSETTSKTCLVFFNGTTATPDTVRALNVSWFSYYTPCYLGNNKSIIAYSGTSSYGTAVVNTAFNADYSSVRGLSTTAVNSGETATVLLSGTASGLSSITQGQQYWLNTDYTMSTAPVSLAIMKNSSTQTGEIFLGVGKSSTEMWFNVDYK